MGVVVWWERRWPVVSTCPGWYAAVFGCHRGEVASGAQSGCSLKPMVGEDNSRLAILFQALFSTQ